MKRIVNPVVIKTHKTINKSVHYVMVNLTTTKLLYLPRLSFIP